LRKELLVQCMERTTFYAQDSQQRGALPPSLLLSIQ
jgi:hypothetical protein